MTNHLIGILTMIWKHWSMIKRQNRSNPEHYDTTEEKKKRQSIGIVLRWDTDNEELISYLLGKTPERTCHPGRPTSVGPRAAALQWSYRQLQQEIHVNKEEPIWLLPCRARPNGEWPPWMPKLVTFGERGDPFMGRAACVLHPSAVLAQARTHVGDIDSTLICFF